MVFCPSIPLQKFFLLQAVHIILKCPLNNFLWMTPYQIGSIGPIAHPQFQDIGNCEGTEVADSASSVDES